MSLAESVVHATLDVYSALKFIPANAAQYSILASFSLVHRASNRITPISLATGAKCLPMIRLSANGDTVHDSHAEVLARRGTIRWFMEELCRSTRVPSDWIEAKPSRKWGLKKGVSVYVYVSSLPCGDASMRTLATAQDPAMAALKAATPAPRPVGNAAARGRDNYALLGVLRTKPGRADSPPTLSMSCSDKIARWCVLGLQGALASHILEPIYVDEIVLGGVDPAVEDSVRADCERAFWRRLDDSALRVPPPYMLHKPQIRFTRLDFPHGRAADDTQGSFCNESICWIANSSSPYEVLINGLRRGVGEKQRIKSHLRPLVSKLALFTLYQQTLAHLGLASLHPGTTYYEAKHAATAYQTAKSVLLSQNSFAGWVVSGKKWESFTVDGVTKQQ